MTFIEVYVGYAIVGIAAFSLVFIWAVRTRQFTDFDRGRYIPLEGERPCGRTGKASPADKWGLRLMVLAAAAMLAYAVFVGLRSA